MKRIDLKVDDNLFNKIKKKAEKENLTMLETVNNLIKKNIPASKKKLKLNRGTKLLMTVKSKKEGQIKTLKDYFKLFTNKDLVSIKGKEVNCKDGVFAEVYLTFKKRISFEKIKKLLSSEITINAYKFISKKEEASQCEHALFPLTSYGFDVNIWNI
jgi:hypothetical protein